MLLHLAEPPGKSPCKWCPGWEQSWGCEHTHTHREHHCWGQAGQAPNKPCHRVQWSSRFLSTLTMICQSLLGSLKPFWHTELPCHLEKHLLSPHHLFTNSHLLHTTALHSFPISTSYFRSLVTPKRTCLLPFSVWKEIFPSFCKISC